MVPPRPMAAPKPMVAETPTPTPTAAQTVKCEVMIYFETLCPNSRPLIYP